MKKLLLLTAFLTLSIVGFSQNAFYGVRTGLNVSNLDFDESIGIENTHRNGFAFGFFAEYDLSENIAIAPELQFSAEGAKDKNLRVDYIQAPILIKYRIGNNISIGAGPLLGIKIHEYEDGFQNFAFSGVAGLEYMITEEIFVDARYSYGFLNIFDDETGLEAKNTNFQIGVGIKM